MNFSSIDIQGNIVSSDILTKIKNDDIRFQKASDFGLDTNTPLRDEIGIAWSAAQAHWKAFSLRRDRLKDKDSGTSETRQSWMVPFMRELGYDIESAKSYVINEKTYAISHKAINRDGFPIHIAGINQSLDKRAEFGTRLSPHALVQEFLNNHEHLYAIVTNGKYLRLLRDATRLARLSYLEFNLEQMMEEELYAEFALLYRVLHSSRMPEKEDAGEDAIIEFYHQEALASGTRIRERLSEAVEQSIKLLANGLLKNPQNLELRERAKEGKLKPDEYYLYMLRTVYRILFLLVIEERHLIYPSERNTELNRKRDIYYKFYSIQRLTKLVESAIYVDPNKTDLWASLMSNFLLFENGFYGGKLGIAPLGSGLFSSSALGDIQDQKMSNETLLRVLRYLVMFENDQGQLTRVNYADLDVEEFGSVYEGLLEYDPQISYGEHSHELNFSFKKGEGRSSSGSHYTPEELVKPLIKHSLDYVIEDKLQVDSQLERKAKLIQQAKNLLTITVCDVACGSGHILLSAARRIGFELAKIRESLDQNADVEQPSPPYLRQAIRDVIKHCIYGVDLNPLAVELCKVAFWLEAHNPGEPLNFLDHHIKNGNAIVGLAHLDELTEGIATEAFKTLPGDDKDVASELRKKNVTERKAREKNVQQGQIAKKLAKENIQKITNQLIEWSKLPENTPLQISEKAKAYDKITKSPQWYRLQQLADIQEAQFFIPKTDSRDFITDGKYYEFLIGENVIQDVRVSLATGKSYEKKFFHWFLEFPEVFGQGGFDCILGNPPFLGGGKISGKIGKDFLCYIGEKFTGLGGQADLVGYFFRRGFDIINPIGFLSLISTNTISQGDTKVGSIDHIINSGGSINHAISSMKWPGEAAVEVTILTLTKQKWTRDLILNGSSVKHISNFLKDDKDLGKPFTLEQNLNLSFLGSSVLGMGFVLEPKEAEGLIDLNPKNKDVLFKYLNGYDLNNDPEQSPSRWVINFFDWSYEKAKKYSDCFKIIEELVKPERTRWKKDKSGNEIKGTFALRKPLPQRWWIYGEKRPKLYATIGKIKRTLIHTRVSKTHAFTFSRTDKVFSDAINVFAFDGFGEFAVLQSAINEWWAWHYSSTMKGDRRYSTSDAFENFPMPESINELEKNGEKVFKSRAELMRNLNLGLTKTYNQINNLTLAQSPLYQDQKQFEKAYGKESWNLYNHLEVKKEGKVSYEEAVPMIFELRRLHKEMDEAVLAAYGWNEDSGKWGEAIKLRHDFYKVDYLPENDRVRYTIHPDARKEILSRLLLLNHERFEEEARQGLHKKKDVEAFYEQKGIEIPEEVTFSDQKRKPAQKKPTKKSKSEIGQTALFETQNLYNSVPSDTTIKEGTSFLMAPNGGAAKWYCIGKNLPGTQELTTSSNLAQAVLGKKAGDQIDFGNGFQILEVK